MPTLNTQAPNMYVNYPDSGDYDLVMVDWKCEVDATNTFWAVINFSTNVIDGYAGFQNNADDHILMFSLWNHGTDYPIVEYVSALTRRDNLTFGNEGNGKHIVTDYEWELNTWYTMCIGTKTVAGITYYAQWVSVQGTNNWLLCGIISYPTANKTIGSGSMFQEDFMSNNYLRQCSIKNAFGRYSSNSTWHAWNTYSLTNALFQYTDSTSPIVVRYDCLYEVDESESIRIRSGGESLIVPVDNDIYPPEELTINSSATPIYHPEWADFIPRAIKNKEGDLYISIGANGTIVLSSSQYYWLFVDTNDDFYYILNEDKTKALTITGTSAGSAIQLLPFAQLDTQKWYNESYEFSEYTYFVPKLALDRELDVNGDAQVGKTLILNTHSTTLMKRRWLALNMCQISAIRNAFSNKYIVPISTRIAQQSNPYQWNFVHAGNDIYYILTLDNTKAITVSGTNNGDNLLCSDYVPGNNNQKWKLQNAGDNLYFLIPIVAQNMNMDIEGVSKKEGANIQLWSHSTTISRYKWTINLFPEE